MSRSYSDHQQNHFHRILKKYVNYYNHHRHHQDIHQQFPILGSRHNRYGPVQNTTSWDASSTITTGTNLPLLEASDIVFVLQNDI